jgi:hypothetical protein
LNCPIHRKIDCAQFLIRWKNKIHFDLLQHWHVNREGFVGLDVTDFDMSLRKRIGMSDGKFPCCFFLQLSGIDDRPVTIFIIYYRKTSWRCLGIVSQIRRTHKLARHNAWKWAIVIFLNLLNWTRKVTEKADPRLSRRERHTCLKPKQYVSSTRTAFQRAPYTSTCSRHWGRW